MKNIRVALTITGIAVIIWFAMSFGQVVAQNKPATGRPQYSSWNMFQIMSEEG